MAAEMPLEEVVFDPAQLKAGMAELRKAIVDLRQQFRQAQPAKKEAIRKRARTGTLKAVRQPAPTAQVGTKPPATAPIPRQSVQESAPLVGVEDWESLEALAAQNRKPEPRKPR
jgi:hypothetical protein